MPTGGDKVGRTCPYCGSVITAEDFFCRACHKRFELQGGETDLTKLATLPEGSVLRLRSSPVAALLSFIGMGWGQFYNGQTMKGLLFNAVYLPFVFGYLPFPSAATVMLAVWILSVIEAPVTSWRINRLATDYTGPSPLMWVEFAALAGLFAWYLFSGDAFFWVRKLYPFVQFFS